MNSTGSNINRKSVQTLIDSLIQKDGIFNRKTSQGFDLLYINSNNKYISVVNFDTPVNVETPKKNLKITSLRILINLDKSTPNCDVVTETPELKNNSAFTKKSRIA